MRIPRRIVDRIAEQARQEAPNEACGYLFGVDDEVRENVPLTNADRSPEHFSLDPREQFAAVREARGRGLAPLAVYHSHPATPARMSHEDIRLARDPRTIYVIYSLVKGEARAFVVRDGGPVGGESASEGNTVIEVPLEITP